ncbi:MAG: tRNA-specific 2-thiouridylase MnmA [Phycisphaerae bacterium]|nr:tRNA-specific 2-thiouridylase MnmA [Phycisphaerae bacterium]
MAHKGGKVVVAMSGGVDSSVAASLLSEQGYDVVGLFMRLGSDTAGAPAGGSRRPHQGCCSAADAADARYVAGQLGIPFYALNFRDDFQKLIDAFADEYARGRTPNPCVTCNDHLKFGRLIEYADAIGASHVATGHYARIIEHDGRPALARAQDASKDQSYFLFGIRAAALDRILFPLGGLHKDEVRKIARQRGFPNHDKPDSVEICFAPDRDYARVVRERRPEAFVDGDVVDAAGRVVGRHDGVPNFTIGQRRGLRIALGTPAYVTQLDVLNNTVTLGPREALLSRRFLADRANFHGTPSRRFRASVKIRHQHCAASAEVLRLEAGAFEATFIEPQSAVTPGQAAVLYEGDVVLGGGWIRETRPVDEDGSGA